MRTRSVLRAAIVLVLAAVAATCEKIPLLAPTGSTITVTADNRVLPPNGSTGITAFVAESGGTPVQNGTTVRFSVTAGRVEPVEALTRNGTANATFFAEGVTGTVTVRAVSGAAGAPSGGTGQAAAASNSVEITIQSPAPTGAAAASDLVVIASPRQLPSSGGTVSVIATVVDSLGRPLGDVPVRFSTTAGALSNSNATTNANGDATVTLTTSRDATVTATITVQGAGTAAATTKSASVEIRSAVANSIAIAVTTQGTVSPGQPVTLQLTPTVGANNVAPRVVIAWGDGTQDDLGAVAAPRTVSHVYNSPGNYTVIATGTVPGESPVSASTIVAVSPRPTIGVNVSGPATPTVLTPATYTATVTPGGESVASYRWEFRSVDPSDNETITTTGNTVTKVFRTIGEKRIDVTVTTTDGRTGTGQTAVVVQAAIPPK